MGKFCDYLNSLNVPPAPVEGPPVKPVEVPKGDLAELFKLNEDSIEFHQLAYHLLKFDAGYETKIAKVAEQVVANKVRYVAAANMIGLPAKGSDGFEAWKFIAGIHNMESGGSFTGNFLNGQPLNQVTTMVPKNEGPFSSWEASVVRGFTLMKWTPQYIGDLTEARAAQLAQRYNGLGYTKNAQVTPYVYSQSNICLDKGKYVADGHYSATADANGQTGCATLWKKLDGAVVPVENPVDIVEKILAKNPGIEPRMVREAAKWFGNVPNKNIALLVNFNLNDIKKRMWAIDLKTGASIVVTHCAEGKNSDTNNDNMPDSFGNVPGSYKSSLGAIRVAEINPNPKWVHCRRLDGLEKGINDKVRVRGIYLHSAPYASSGGDTLGCFGIPTADLGGLMPLVEGCLLFSWDDTL